jgi:hypothetical protein
MCDHIILVHIVFIPVYAEEAMANNRPNDTLSLWEHLLIFNFAI